MALKVRRSEEYELLRRASSDSIPASPSSDLEDDVPLTNPFLRNRWFERLETFSIRRRIPHISALCVAGRRSPRNRRRMHWSHICCYATILCAGVIFLLVLVTAIFWPSYTHLPHHYAALQKFCTESTKPGRGNINNEKVFIAAALYDPQGTLIGGDWGNALLGLVDLLGPDNVYVSVYENDADSAAKSALNMLRDTLNCPSSLISEHLPLEDIPRVTTPTGERRMNRIAFLAEVRNRALRPLQTKSSVVYDKILFINDVMFRPIDAVHLLFSTNVDSTGRAQYGAVCAVDFINAFKFYDRFATRDLEGYEMGIPFFPWFTSAGNGVSRQDVLDQKDAVRVRACWGGMTAFEAKWFIQTGSQGTFHSSSALDVSPLRFRYEEDPFWESSECCLIHADLSYLRHGSNITADSGIYTNPYIRVAYDSQTLGWLPLTRRVEHLYSFVHNILNYIVDMPYPNPRRLEQPGDEVVERVWKWNNSTGEAMYGLGTKLQGSYHDVRRIAGPGRFCGGRTLQVLHEDPKPGKKKWTTIPLPSPPK